METEVVAILKCNECTMEVRRRERDLDNPEVMSTDHVVATHRKETGHTSYSLDIEDTVTFEIEIITEDAPI